MSTGGGGPAFEVYGDIGLDTSKVEERLDKLKALMQKTADAMAALQAKIQGGQLTGQGLADAQARLGQLQDVFQQLNDKAVGLVTTNSVLDASLRTSGAGWSKFGQTILQVGYIADDVQYGFQAIANNIPMLFVSMGPAAMGAAAITATATNQIIKHWQDIGPAVKEVFDGIGISIDNIIQTKYLTGFEDLTNRVKSLKDAAHDSVEEYHRLLDAERELTDESKKAEAFKGIARPKPDAEAKAAGEAAGKFVAEDVPGGGDKLVTDILTFMRGKGTTATLTGAELPTKIKETRKEIEDLERQLKEATPGTMGEASIREGLEGSVLNRLTGGRLGTEGARSRLKRLQAEEEAKARESLGRTLGGAAGGDEGDISFLEGMLPALDPELGARLKKAIDDARRKAKGVKDKDLTDAATENERKTLEILKEENPAMVETFLTAIGDEEGLRKFRREQNDKLRQQGEANERETIERLKKENPAMAEAMLRAGGADPQAAQDLIKQRNEALNEQGKEGERLALEQAREFRPDVAEALIAQQNDPAALERFRKSEAEKRKQESLKAAKEVIPGVESLAEFGLLHTPGDAAKADEEIRKELVRRLGAAGLNEGEAGMAAAELVKQGRQKIDANTLQFMLGGPAALAELMGGDQPKRSSQTMDALSYAHAIQAGVGGENMDRQKLQRLDKQITIMNQIQLLLANNRRGVRLPAR